VVASRREAGQQETLANILIKHKIKQSCSFSFGIYTKRKAVLAKETICNHALQRTLSGSQLFLLPIFLITFKSSASNLFFYWNPTTIKEDGKENMLYSVSKMHV